MAQTARISKSIVCELDTLAPSLGSDLGSDLGSFRAIMALLQLHTLAQLAAELPSLDDALDELIARAHQVDSEAAAWAADVAEVQAARDAELDDLRAQVAALEARLASAEVRADRAVADAKARDATPAPAPVTPPVTLPAAPPARRTPWLGLAGAFAAGLATTFAIVSIPRGDAPPAPRSAVPAPPTIVSPPAPDLPPPAAVPAPPPSEPAAVASPRPVRRRTPPAPPPSSARLIDPFSSPQPAKLADEPIRHPADTPAPAKPGDKPRGELIDPFQSQ
jgi:hypothetical protein